MNSAIKSAPRRGTDESRRFLDYVRHFAEEATRAGASADEAEREGWGSLARVALTANEFLYVD